MGERENILAHLLYRHQRVSERLDLVSSVGSFAPAAVTAHQERIARA